MQQIARIASRTVIAFASAGLVLTGTTASARPEPATPSGPDESVVTMETFAPADSAEPARTYDPDLVPVGAGATVVTMPLAGDGRKWASGGTTTMLVVRGLAPNREYGAHAHVNTCGATGDAAGAHFQHVEDPVQPSTDPRYANPRNEIWLDFTTDAAGSALVISRVPWRFAERRANSVVIHDHHTHRRPGEAGAAGDRLACVTVDF